MSSEQDIQAIESDLSILLKSLTNVSTTATVAAKDELDILEKEVDALENKIGSDLTELLKEEERVWDTIIAEEEAEKKTEDE